MKFKIYFDTTERSYFALPTDEKPEGDHISEAIDYKGQTFTMRAADLIVTRECERLERERLDQD